MKTTRNVGFALSAVVIVSVVAVLAVASATDVSAQFGGPRQTAVSPIPYEFTGVWGWDTVRQSCGTLLDSFGRPAIFGDGKLEGNIKVFANGNPNLCAWPFGEMEKVMNGRGRLWWKTFSADDAVSPKWTCGVSWGRMVTGGGGRTFMQRADHIEMQFATASRFVWTDGRKHPPAFNQYYLGHSIGWMDGDTFVVETTNFTWDPDAYDDQAHFARSHLAKWVERYTLKGKDAMEVQFIIEDPVFLKDTFRWTAKLKRSNGPRDYAFECDPQVEGEAIYSTFKNPYPDDNTYERFFGAKANKQ